MAADLTCFCQKYPAFSLSPVYEGDTSYPCHHPTVRTRKLPVFIPSFTAKKRFAMSRFSEDPFLCKDCQKLGYCRLRAMQAEAERRAMQEKSAELNFRRQTSFQYPMLSADPEPMPTFREFVAVHRPDLSKHLPQPANTQPSTALDKRPSLGELRARIAERRLSAAPESPSPKQVHPPEPEPMPASVQPFELELAVAPLALPKKRSSARPRSSNLRFSIDLRRYPHHSIDKRILPPKPHSTIFWSVDNRTSLTSFSSLEI
jgi:hypothetical protein